LDVTFFGAFLARPLEDREMAPYNMNFGKFDIELDQGHWWIVHNGKREESASFGQFAEAIKALTARLHRQIEARFIGL
jgi:hypothetical protein